MRKVLIDAHTHTVASGHAYSSLQEMATDEAVITLQGLSLDDVWNSIVATIGGLDAQAEESIVEQIIHREQREKLLRQIELLEKQCRAEKQTRKKYELNRQLLKLKTLIS